MCKNTDSKHDIFIDLYLKIWYNYFNHFLSVTTPQQK